MLAPAVTPIVITPPMDDIPGAKSFRCISRRHLVLMICIFEVFGSIGAAGLYIYALGWNPEWGHMLVPIPKDLCNSKQIVDGVMYIIILICSLELLMALYLFDGARRECLSRARFWLASMFTYMILVTVVILGLDLGGIRCPTMNSAAFINIFVRFLEILIVFSWTEQESMNRLRYHRGGRRSLQGGVSTMTISTIASGVMQGNPGGPATTIVDCEPTPPPSYSATIPPGETLLTPSQPRIADPISLRKDDEDVERTELWKKQWE